MERHAKKDLVTLALKRCTFTLQCMREKSFHFAANDTIAELFELYYFALFRGHTVQRNTSSYAQTECIDLCTPPLGGYIVEKINS